ncbi:uncharacterized protein TRIADDRAFT_58842 [Trichoplax adhaerens]|uniref:UBC core domain-containing protein n=1 Tax=Trichoplax adhaerens TaxID=10228 RepID=B3S3T8_TRIAD|nr:hypothetical protein TRIADDRAFT_58842 [Trichoplax adhaerens]EDV22523.1 hypothetical protein TRIADDRAFT_58842 [Trichoplax adhaerens]|eukprot:XP_002115067.1 hypothetical protein TRIADDRAFT_58842 [Trichoplax adhaerens]
MTSGGIFRVLLYFSENYNVKPPRLLFHTIPFHPNVDMQTGRPCIDFLDDESLWSDKYDIKYILQTLQTMLSNPVLDNAVNIEACRAIESSQDVYEAMVKDCVEASKRVADGLTPFPEPDHDEERRIDDTRFDMPLNLISNSHVSYEQYYNTWMYLGTASSKPDYSDAEFLVNKYYTNMDLNSAKANEATTKSSSLFHGQFKHKSQQKSLKELKATKIELAKKLGLSNIKENAAETEEFLMESEMLPNPAKTNYDSQDQDWEKEVDSLVQWTNNLGDVDSIY